MIVTVTANPAIDQTLWLAHFETGRVNRPRRSQIDPAGKGVNVSRMAHRLGHPTLAMGFLAGETGKLVEARLDAEGVQHHFVRVDGQTRIDVTIVDETTGTTTSLYDRGPTVDGESVVRFEEMLGVWVRAAKVFVLAGSLPPGIGTDAYARWIAIAHRAGVPTILDASGECFREGIRAGPTLIKPNRREAEEALGRLLPDEAAVLDGARELGRSGTAVVISLGERGALCVRGKDAVRVMPPRVELKSTVGSGDSLVAGLAVGLASGDLFAGLKLGTAAGAATAESAGTALGTAERVHLLEEQVRLETL